MTIFKHEIKRGKKILIIWTAVISFMLALCILIYPEMKTQMEEISDMFQNMGDFSQAFGMDKLNFGEFIGFFGIECGNVLGLGGGFLAAILGATALSKEENEKTAEFLLTHPVSRTKIIAEKFCSVIVQLLLLNALVILITIITILAVGEKVQVGTIALIFLAYFIMQVEIACITFGISSFISRGSISIGIGIVAAFYFMNIIANLTENVEFIKYITPFGYTDASNIIADKTLEIGYLLIGVLFSVLAVLFAFCQYNRKDISN